MLSLRQVRYFLGVAGAGKISAAATDLGISQSAITMAIKELEAELGVALLERRAGGVSLTRAGQNFVAHARNIEASVADAVLDMKRDSTDLAGHIRLGVTHTGAGYFLVPPLARFRRTHPGVTVDLRETDRPDMEDALLRGDIDVALMVVSNLARAEALGHQTLMRSPRGLWLSSSHPLLRRETVTLADVVAHPFILLLTDEADRSARHYMTAAGLTPNVVFETSALEAVRSMVAAGLGVTILSRLVHRPWSLDGGRVEWRLIEDAPPTLDIGLVWRRGHAFTAAEERLREYLVDAAG